MKPLYFRKILLLWYSSNKRDLPWREKPSPYNVWISEIILQQTRIDQGIKYYYKLISKYPDLKSLASASEQDILKMWQGLGYYSRARNLLSASKQILNNYNGIFPTSCIELKKIKGVGEYTASAVASIAFNEPVAAIDGNAYRVLSRIFSINLPIDTATGKNYFKKLANEIIDRKNPGDFNQAIMDFGSLQCIPVSPDCTVCPFHNECSAFLKGMVHKFPLKKGKTQLRNRYFHYLVIEQGPYILFNKRIQNDIWKNLYDFPLIETSQPIDHSELIFAEKWKNIFNQEKASITHISEDLIHLLTHQRIHTRFYHILPDSLKNIPSQFSLIDKKDIFDLPVPKIIENYLLKLGFVPCFFLKI
jgi:A/G-specific adenine glycosylase